MDTSQSLYQSPQRTNEVHDYMDSPRHMSMQRCYHTPHSRKSVESPYTSLESGQSSYTSIKHGNYTTYGSLRAKAEKANILHHTRSKAVMEALEGLQGKITQLELDRAQAESNLKSLATETNDYKDLLRQQHAFNNTSGSLGDSHSKELESQLENAQNRAQILEKQLEYMRKMMQNQAISSPRTNVVTSVGSAASPVYSITTSQQLVKSPAKAVDSIQSPAMEKLNDLEREHIKLSESQNLTENKIRELEERILEERHHRKLLQDKAAQLQNAVATNRIMTDVNIEPNEKVALKTKRRKKVVRSSSCNVKSSTKEPAKKIQSPNHYHLDLANIPFVVGQSTCKSHALGANIQNVLSIMKSHNRLCNGDPIQTYPPKCKSTYPVKSSIKSKSDLNNSNEDMNNLLVTLQDEFAQFGFEHREIAAQILELDDDKIIADLEKELEGVVERMEMKGKQIHLIRDHLKSFKKKKKKKSENKITVGGSNSQEFEVVTTIRTKKELRSPDAKSNPNLEMLKNVQKLQSTLRKDDLKWE